MRLIIRPVTFRTACDFVNQHHRHNKAPRGHKFSIGCFSGEDLVGVAMIGRPVARSYDDGLTFEVNRTCTTGFANANSKLYGAAWAAAKAMGYKRGLTYTQHDESGSSLRAVGWFALAKRAARKGWAESTANEALRNMRDPIGSGGVERILWVIGDWPTSERSVA